MDKGDYLKFYDHERYLLDEVGPRFRGSGNLEPADFYTILVWKANRAKNYHRDRLKEKAGTFKDAVSKIGYELYVSTERKLRLQSLTDNWGFAPPTATAILTILYPDDFSVYDGRVCDELKCDYRPGWRKFSDELWTEYETFQRAVNDEAPAALPCGIKIDS